MNRRIIFSVLFFLLLGINLRAQQIEQPEITISELRRHIATLASDSLKGRKPGTRGGKLAANYIKKDLIANNLSLLGDNGFQYFQVVSSIEAGENNHLSFGQFEGKLGDDFIPLSFSANDTISAPAVFVGYGFDFEEDTLSWHDYAGIDIDGKWVMVLRGNPEIDQSNSLFEPYSSLRKKVLVARDHQAAGVLFVSGVHFDKDDQLIKLRYDKSTTDAGIPAIHIKRKVADSLMAMTGETIAQLEEQLNRSYQPNSFSIDVTVSAITKVIKNMARTQNVVAFLSGTDPKLKERTIVLGAHYDHLGLGGPGSGSRRPDTLAVHNGADDNASGVAAILEIIEKFAANQQQLKRSILFIAFGAEEMGILGSKYFTEHPLIELDRISCMFNLDMIGRFDPESGTIGLGGTGTAVHFEKIIKQAKSNYDIRINLSEKGYGPSDHASFYMKDIPVLFLFTYPHQDYHTPADDVDKINFEGLKILSDFVYDLAANIANRSQLLTYQKAGPKSPPSMKRRFKVTLGIMPDFTSKSKNGLGVDAVIPNRPADQAGMKKGDVIVAMEGKPVRDIYDYMNRLSEFHAGQRISVEVMRNGEKVILIVEL